MSRTILKGHLVQFILRNGRLSSYHAADLGALRMIVTGLRMQGMAYRVYEVRETTEEISEQELERLSGPLEDE